MQTHEEMRRKHVLIPQEMKDRGDRLEALMVEIKRQLEIIAARQLVQIQLMEEALPQEKMEIK